MTQVPERLLGMIRCLECGGGDIKFDTEDGLQCPQCDARYPVHDGVPSILKGGPESQNWNPWRFDKVQMMAHSYYKRASGELPEKEASKSYARLLDRKGLYEPGDTLLDVGCASGHFLRSFRRLLDPEIHYTGVDIHGQYLQWGKEVFGVDDHCSFVHCDALSIPVADNTFDTVIVNLFHFFPRIDDALRESMRVAGKRLIWRTPVGEVNYAVKVFYNQSFEEIQVLTADREDIDYSLYMLYSIEYIKGLVKSLGGNILFIERDTDFEDFDNTAIEDFQHVPSTKTVAGMQLNGNLLLDWHYIAIECS